MRRALGRLNDVYGFGCEDAFERGGKFAVTVTQQKADQRVTLAKLPDDLMNLLVHSELIRVCRAACEMNASRPKFDEEQNVQRLEKERFNRENRMPKAAACNGA
ncbi:MAG: hypothetical protein SF123_11390 [Chloroflexota bacterium]|nr:hypothetical protein [Chloroflexota bacterium]